MDFGKQNIRNSKDFSGVQLLFICVISLTCALNMIFPQLLSFLILNNPDLFLRQLIQLVHEVIDLVVDGVNLAL